MRKVHFPPRSVCPTCHRKSIGKIQPLKLRGDGEIYSYTVVHEAPSQFEMQKPYVMAIIRMREGVMVTGQVIDVEANELAIGLKVKATMRKLGSRWSRRGHPLRLQVRAGQGVTSWHDRLKHFLIRFFCSLYRHIELRLETDQFVGVHRLAG